MPARVAVPPVLVRSDTWPIATIRDAGLDIEECDLVSIGGGLGSFALADLLRVIGVPASRITVVSRIERPYETYRHLARASQIPDHERLRSDSGSTMDAVWGWPGYALREAADSGGRAAVGPLLRVLVEPLLADFYTPQADQVYESVDREAARIGWPRMLWNGQARMVRRNPDGGFLVLVNDDDAPGGRVVLSSRHVHVAVGYPGLRLLPDLQDFIAKHGDLGRIVNAYTPHDHVYEQAAATGATVMVRGSGIVASRVLQRLLDDVERGAGTTIVHLFRTYVGEPQGDSPFFRRPSGDGFAYQAFNFPKASWGGQLKTRLEQATPAERADLLDALGGTNTPHRRKWQQQLDEGRSSGRYQVEVGVVTDIEKYDDRLAITWRTPQGGDKERRVDFVIDATGLESSIEEHALFRDLLEHGGATKNPKGRLDVAETFEVSGTRSGAGRLYASGSATLGGPYAGVDSFLGLQYAALQIADDLARTGWCPRLTTIRSVRGWWRWARNRPVDHG